MGVLKQLLHELQQIQNVTILFIKFNVKLYVSRFGVTIDGRVKLQCIYMYLPRITLIQLLFIRSGAQSPYGMTKTSHLFSQDVTIFNWYLKSLIQLMVTLHLYLFIIKIMLSKHIFVISLSCFYSGQDGSICKPCLCHISTGGWTSKHHQDVYNIH